MITSVSNNRVKKVVALNQKAKERRQEKLYVVEGVKMFLEAPDEEIVEVYVSENFSSAACEEKIARLRGDGLQAAAGAARAVCGDAGRTETVEGQRGSGAAASADGATYTVTRRNRPYCETVSDEVFRKMSDTMAPQGILCVLRMKEYSVESMISGENPLIMVLEDLQDPGNLGTILRTGEGAGISGVILSRESADIYNPKTIRSTMGSIYRVPFVYVSSIKDAVDMLKEKGIGIYAAHLAGKLWYDEANYAGGSAFMIGNEGNGLKDETAALADTYIKIPMEGHVESLNAAMASGILMYEASRQRRQK